jgi:sugar phosphate permease
MTVTLTGSLLMVAAHTYQLLLPECDKCFQSLIPLGLLGMSYAAYAVVLWGSIPYMVEGRTLGTAFGICTVFQNLGTAIAPIILGFIQEKTKEIDHGFFYVEVFMIFVSLIALLCNLAVFISDKKSEV